MFAGPGPEPNAIDKGNKRWYTDIRRLEMRRLLPSVLIAVLLAASSGGPMCEIVCAAASDGTAAVEALQGAQHGGCHEGAGAAESGRRQHPCKKGSHHHDEWNASLAPRFVAHVAGPEAIPGGLEAAPAVEPAGTVAGEAVLKEIVSPPRLSLSLRI